MIDLTKNAIECSQCGQRGTVREMVPMPSPRDSWLCGKCAETIRREAKALKAKLLEAAK